MLRLMRDGERPRAPELRLRARAPLPATVAPAAIRLFKNTQLGTEQEINERFLGWAEGWRSHGRLEGAQHRPWT